MKRIRFILLLFIAYLPAPVHAEDAVTILDKAVDGLKSDLALHISFSYTLFDESGYAHYADNGSIKMDTTTAGSERYVLLTDPMKIWCDGETLWSYASGSDEIYITDADSDDSHFFSPMRLMQLYKDGYKCSVTSDEKRYYVLLRATDAENMVEEVQINLNVKTLRPEMLHLRMSEQGRVKVVITDYNPGSRLNNRVYSCPLEDYPDAEVVDMR